MKKIYNQLLMQKNFNIVLNNYPNTEYAIDAEFKIDLIDDILAAKEILRYYFDKKMIQQ